MDAFLHLSLSPSHTLLLFVCLAVALGFEFVNGFHDTANAVATVIYTHSLRPGAAVLLSGLCNFAGVFVGGIAVALGIIKLLPLELLVDGGSGGALAMLLALLSAAILWNVGTWYLGIPASSSHTLIGAILGVGLANSLRAGHRFGAGVNWAKATEIGLSLLVSPVFGFAAAAGLLLLLKRVVREPKLFEAPVDGAPPPLGIRALLIATCSGVSFAHGSNDGQKGVGLVMLILMGLLPAGFALDREAPRDRIAHAAEAAASLDATLQSHAPAASATEAATARTELSRVRATLAGRARVDEIPEAERFGVRQAILLADKSLDRLARPLHLDAAGAAQFKRDRAALRAVTDYAPGWVIIAIAIALGLGTTVGWKRIVVTVGEKIGKAHLNYAQGACAELVAMSTIGLSSWFGLPVSTTHVLSSGVAGTMVAQRAGLQRATVRNIALAWLLTLPVSMLLAGVLYGLFRLAFA